jgi:hypothetical protein
MIDHSKFVVKQRMLAILVCNILGMIKIIKVIYNTQLKGYEFRSFFFFLLLRIYLLGISDDDNDDDCGCQTWMKGGSDEESSGKEEEE